MQSAWPIRKARPYHWVSYAVVQERWKLLTNRDSSHVELYDLVADPYEKVDLEEDKPRVVQRLLQRLDSWKATLPKKPSGEVFSSERAGRTSDQDRR